MAKPSKHPRPRSRTPPKAPVGPSTPTRRQWIFPLALAVVTAVSYANSLSAPFVLDDHSTVLDNPTIRSLWPLTAALHGPAQFPTAGRPLINLSFAINYAMGGVSPAGYHLWNLAVHILCGLALFGIIRRTQELMAQADRVGSSGTRDSVVAFVCALIWLVHPLQTEVIDYVTERTESMMGLGFLLTLYCAVRGFSSVDRSRRWYAGSVLACAFGMACKESMATAPVIVLLYDRIFVSGTFRGALTRRPVLYAGLASTWLLLLALNISGPRFRSAGFSADVSPWTYLLNQSILVCRYLRLAIWPHGLVLDYGVPRPLHLTDVVPYGLVIVSLLAATLALWRRRPRAAFLGLWFFITLAPTSSIVPIATEVGAERRMYLPLAALVVLVVFSAYRVAARLASRRDRHQPVLTDSRPNPAARAEREGGTLVSATGAGGSWRTGDGRAAVTATLVAVAGVLALLTVQRNAEYGVSPAVLWQTVLDRYPHGRAHYNLGVILREQGRREEAIREYTTAAKELPDAEYAIGFELSTENRHAEAVTHLREYIRLKPEDENVIRAYNLLGRSLAASGQTEDAIATFRRVLTMQARNVDAMGGLADGLLKQQRLDEAIVVYQEYVRLAPPNPGAYFNLGLALGRLQRDEEAVAAFTKAVELNPRDPGFRVNLASGLVATGRMEEAIEEYGRAAGLETDPEARNEIAAIIRGLAAQNKGAR